MSIWQSVKNLFLEEREKIPHELNKDDEALLQYLGIDIGEVNIRGKNALKVATVFACIKILAESVGKLPLKVYKEDQNGIQQTTNHYLTSLLKLRPNPHMSTITFFETLETQLGLCGNSYASIEFDHKGRIIGLWPMDSTKITMYIDDIGLLGSHSSVWYQVNTGKEIVKLRPYELLHFKNSVTLNGLVGVSAIDQLKASFENVAKAEKFVSNFYKQGLQAKGIIQYVGDLDEKAKRNFRDKFEDMSSGLKNSHRISLLPVGYQYVPIAMNMHDAQFLENTELNIRQIANAYGIKMHQLNDLSRSTHSNIEQQNADFYSSTLMSKLTMYEQELTYKLFLDSEIHQGVFARFNVDALLRADLKTRYEAYRVGINAGFLKVNEARGKENLPPEKGGDTLLVNGTMVPIELAGAAYKNKLKGGGNGDNKKSGTKNDKGTPSNSD